MSILRWAYPHHEIPTSVAPFPLWIERLGRRPVLCGALALGYFVATTLLHDVMQQPAYWAQGQLSHRSWNRLVTFTSLPFLVAFCAVVINWIRRHPRPGIAVSYLAFTILLAIVSFRTLLVMNIEVIHFPQYAILACLLFPLIYHYGQTMVWATLGALIDEGYQYFFLYADRRIHMDFNDVILNTIGAGFGAVLIFSALGPPREARHDPPSRRLAGFVFSPACLVAGVGMIVCTVLYGLGRLRLLPLESGAWAIVLRRGGPSSAFWTPTDWGKTFHEVQPLEWLFVTVILVGVYWILDWIQDVAPRR